MRIWSKLSHVSWFAECSIIYFRSFINIFQAQLPPIPIPNFLQLKTLYLDEAAWHPYFTRIVSTYHFSYFLFEKSQWPRAGLPLNSVVRILDLQKRPELNGQLGTVVGWDTVEDRCQAGLRCRGFESIRKGVFSVSSHYLQSRLQVSGR